MNSQFQAQSITDISRWTKTAQEVPRWDKRNELIAEICRKLAINSVLDFGAGNQTLRSHLGSSVKYVPIDCVASTPDVFVCDYNQNFKLPQFDQDVCFVFSGFLEYILRLDEFFEKLSLSANGQSCIFSYAALPAEYDRRIANGWLNNLGDTVSIAKYFNERFKGLKLVAQWNGQLLFIGTIK